jgi:serine/threonine-protein kinase
LKVGSIIAGKLRIERVIGRGAMGVVVEATDVTTRRRVAVKLILPQHAEDAQLRGRFVREANTMMRLKSEHVARVYSAGELDDGMLYLEMELLTGQTLEQLVKEGGPLPVTAAVDLILEALDAIAEAHDLGLVHRDLKPSNLFLSAREGRSPIVKVLDFGIVKDESDGAKLTAAGTLPGTPAYMAPEQIALEEHLIDARADVWALGVTFHEILTGSLPFTGQISEMLPRIRAEAAPRLRSKRSDVSFELEAVVERCLAKRPADRFASGRELAEALAALPGRGIADPNRVADRTVEVIAIRAPLSERSTSPRSSRPRGGRGVLVVLAMLVAVASVAGAVRLARTRILHRPPPPVASISPLTDSHEGLSTSAAVPVPPPSAPVESASALEPSATPLASSSHHAPRHVRLVSARNTGDRAWRGWVERHRQRLEACAVHQPCPVSVALHLTRLEGKVGISLDQASVSRGLCGLQRSLAECLGAVAKDPVPPPDLCHDPADCHADVVLAFD